MSSLPNVDGGSVSTLPCQVHFPAPPLRLDYPAIKGVLSVRPGARHAVGGQETLPAWPFHTPLRDVKAWNELPLGG